MDAFLIRRKRKSSPQLDSIITPEDVASRYDGDGEESTDTKLAILSSLHPGIDQETLLDLLLAHDGSVQETSQALKHSQQTKKAGSGVVAQSSLRTFAVAAASSGPIDGSNKKAKLLSRKGATLHLFDPEDVSEHTPCTLIKNFLPPEDADQLLIELLEESKTFEKITFKLFDNVVSSPHTSSFFVGTSMELDQQKREYVYNGARLTDVRKITPQLDKVKARVQETVNLEIAKRIRTHHGGKKLKHQSPDPWCPNAAFVNCYNGPQESVGWHSDQLTYLGPRAIIGSLSLGVTREFRVRRILPPTSNTSEQDAQGQIAIHLPHNSLLIMHAEMQEEWKHSIAPASAIDPHPVAGNRRINITYRHYREAFHPRYTPRCDGCNVPCVLRVVQRKRENWGRYFWMCHAGNVPGKEGCSFFQWAEFDEDGNPLAFRGNNSSERGRGSNKAPDNKEKSSQQ